jgi:hypothetical protein
MELTRLLWLLCEDVIVDARDQACCLTRLLALPPNATAFVVYVKLLPGKE